MRARNALSVCIRSCNTEIWVKAEREICISHALENHVRKNYPCGWCHRPKHDSSLLWCELRPAHDKGTNDRQPKKNHYRKHKTDNDCGERPIKPSANYAGLLLSVSWRHSALPPMMKASTIPIVITATTGKMMQKMTNIANHQSFPIATSSTHLP